MKIALMLIILLTGCATTYPTPKGLLFSKPLIVPDAQALAYFYQPKFKGVVACLMVNIDSDGKACIGYPGYAEVFIEPGERNISFTPQSLIKIPTHAFKFNFESGKTYYFELQNITPETNKEMIVQKNHNAALGLIGWVLINETEASGNLQKLRAWE